MIPVVNMKNTTKPYRPSFLTTLLYGIAANVPRKEGASGILRGIMLGSGVLTLSVMLIIVNVQLYTTPRGADGAIALPQVSSTMFYLVTFGPCAVLTWYHCNSARFKRNARLFLGTPELRRASQKRGWAVFLFAFIVLGLMFPRVMPAQ